MHPSLKTFTSLALGAAAFAVAACSDSTDPSSASGNGRVVVRLTDAPFLTDSVESVDMFVVRVDARGEAADSAAADTDVENTSSGGWKTIATPNASFDLLELRNGAQASLGEASLPAGTYSGLRFIIDASKSSVTLKNGTTLNGNNGIKFPSADKSGLKVMLTEPLKVVGGATTTLLLDFDVNESFVMRGNSIAKNGLLFKPVIKATIIDAATVNATVRLANATPTALNFLQGTTALTGGSNIATGTSSACSSVNAATPNLSIVPAGSTTALPGFAPTLSVNTSYTIVAYPGTTAGSVQFATLGNVFTPTTGQAGLRVFNGTGIAYDVIATPTVGTALTIGNTLAAGSSNFVSAAAGATTFIVAAPGTTTALATLTGQSLTAGQNATLVIAPPVAPATAPQLFIVPGC